MENQKIIDKLNELKNTLTELKKIHHSKGADKFESERDLIKRIIDRTYPEKDAKELKDRLMYKAWAISGNETDEYWQKFYLNKIDLAIRVIDTILKEYELFGFDDFKPIKEKVETEAKVKMGLFSLGRKTTKEK